MNDFNLRYSNKEIFDNIIDIKQDVNSIKEQLKELKGRQVLIEKENRCQNRDIAKLGIRLSTIAGSVSIIVSLVIKFIF